MPHIYIKYKHISIASWYKCCQLIQLWLILQWFSALIYIINSALIKIKWTYAFTVVERMKNMNRLDSRNKTVDEKLVTFEGNPSLVKTDKI